VGESAGQVRAGSLAAGSQAKPAGQRDRSARAGVKCPSAQRVERAQVVKAEVRGEHTLLPPQCCGQHPAQPVQLFVCWQTQRPLKIDPTKRAFSASTSTPSPLPLVSRNPIPHCVNFRFYFDLLPKEALRDFRPGRSRRQAGILLGTSDQVTATEKLLLNDPSWV
jgi:hypothetical protein